MPPVRDRFCSSCGTAFEATHAYPRACVNRDCGLVVWANPIPVAVMLVPVEHAGRTGLLVVRRGVEPKIGSIALVSGFVEEHERWQTGAAREVVEEVGVVVDESTVTLFDTVSSHPRPNRLLVFATCAPVRAADFAPFAPNSESLARGIVFGPDGLDRELAFGLHAQMASRWFAQRGVTSGALDLVEL
jgi:ADP-ribose pyrophosphatase YjhB (NUDIX family)